MKTAVSLTLLALATPTLLHADDVDHFACDTFHRLVVEGPGGSSTVTIVKGARPLGGGSWYFPPTTCEDFRDEQEARFLESVDCDRLRDCQPPVDEGDCDRFSNVLWSSCDYEVTEYGEFMIPFEVEFTIEDLVVIRGCTDCDGDLPEIPPLE